MYRILLAFPILAFLIQACTPSPATEQPTVKSFAEDSSLIQQIREDTSGTNLPWIMGQILGSPKHQIHNIGILAYEGVNDLDLFGPRYVFGQYMGARTRIIAVDPGPVHTVMGVEIKPDLTIDSVQHLDILVIPGGGQGTVRTAYDPQVQEWIRKIDQTTTYTASVCTGGWILGASGLLKGKNVSTNWYRATEMMEKYGANYTGNRYTNDGKYWTSAGVTAGMDMSLAILNDIWGIRYTRSVMLDMEYDPQPPIPGGSPEKSGWLVSWMMRSMYDASILPLVDSLDRVN